MPSGIRLQLTGRVTKLNLKETSAGKDLLSFSLPCEYGKKGADGKRPCVWFRVNALEHNARSLHSQLQEGDHVVIQADSLTAKAYQDRQGEPRASLDVWVQDWQVSKLCWRKKDDIASSQSDSLPDEGNDDAPPF